MVYHVPMNAQQYTQWTQPLRSRKHGPKALNRVNDLLTGVCYVLYPLLVIVLATTHDPFLLKAVLVPGVSFVGLTLLRKAFNCPRPYEVLDIEPLIKKDTCGKSFPSRHTFSCFIIALTWLAYFAPVGMALLAAGVTLAFTRVLGGVHFPRDVIAAAVIAFACAAVGYLLVP